MGERKVSWGNGAIDFIDCHGDGRDDFYRLPFPVGPQGPMDGFLGSPERERYVEMCRRWMARGELPDGTTMLDFGHSYWAPRWEKCDCGARYVQDCKRGPTQARTKEGSR